MAGWRYKLLSDNADKNREQLEEEADRGDLQRARDGDALPRP